MREREREESTPYQRPPAPALSSVIFFFLLFLRRLLVEKHCLN